VKHSKLYANFTSLDNIFLYKIYSIIITDNAYTNTIKYLIKYVESQVLTYNVYIYIYIYIYIYMHIGIAHIVHEACSYSVASSVMEHVLAVHSVIWYCPHRAEHTLHLHSSLGSWNLSSLQNLK